MVEINWGISCDSSSPELLQAISPPSTGGGPLLLYSLKFRVFFFFLGRSDFDTSFPGTRTARQAERSTQNKSHLFLLRALSTAAPRGGVVVTFCGMHSSLSRGQSRHSQVLGTYGIIQEAYKIQPQRYRVNNVYNLYFV